MEGTKTAIVKVDDMGMLINAALLVKQCHDDGTLTGDIVDMLGMMLFITIENAVIDPE